MKGKLVEAYDLEVEIGYWLAPSHVFATLLSIVHHVGMAYVLWCTMHCALCTLFVSGKRMMDGFAGFQTHKQIEYKE